jgi:hypothetical protein
LMIPEYPDTSSIRSLEATEDRLVAFIDFRRADRALALAGELNRSCPSVGSVALNVGSSQTDLIAIVRAGICEVLPQPFSDQDVGTAVLNVRGKLTDANGSVAQGVGRSAVKARSWAVPAICRSRFVSMNFWKQSEPTPRSNLRHKFPIENQCPTRLC